MMRLLLLCIALFSVLLAKGIKSGVERWDIKTTALAGADLAHGKTVALADLIAKARPGAASEDERPPLCP